jgi:ribose transport system substrate-binding protein
MLSLRRERGSSGDPGYKAKRPGLSQRARSLRNPALRNITFAAAALACLAISVSAASASGSAAASGTANAQAAINPYLSHASDFPVKTALGGKLRKGTTFAFLECGNPICALNAELLAPAVKAIGAKLKIINSGSTAASSQSAAASALSLKPAAVLVLGLDLSIYGNGLKKLKAAGIKVVSISETQPIKQFGITFNYVGLKPLETAGRLLADWVITHKGPKANVAFYGAPQVPYTTQQEAAFTAELHKNCPSCTARFVSIDITTAGTTAPQTIVTDLQSHPSTNYMVVAPAELAQGLPAAMQSAGLSVPDIGYSPEPEELQDIKDGGMTAGLASDISTQTWAWVDATARLVLKEKPTAGEVAGFGPFQFLTQKQITFNPAMGWTGYPNYAKRFEKLWHTS